MGNDDESSETAADLGNDFSLLLQEKLEDEKVKLRQWHMKKAEIAEAFRMIESNKRAKSMI